MIQKLLALALFGSDGFIQDLEIDLPANPEWNTFKLRLLRRENLTRSAWEAFQKARFGTGGAPR
ncbi:MAG TPA: hypothetical protein VGA78_18980 [Gemmatimonadales bacterium]